MSQSKKPPVAPDFFTPESMARQAAEAIGVYGGYKTYAESGGTARISRHAVIEDAYADSYVANILPLLRRRGLPAEGAVLDAGCGPGTITAALRRALGGATAGIDLSEPIIAAATARYPDVDYRVCSADAPNHWLDGHFRLIHSREFYPFTRTNDLDLYSRFLAAWRPKLVPGGLAAAVQVVTPECMERVWPQTRDLAARLGYTASGREVVVPLRLTRKLGPAVNSAAIHPILSLGLSALETARPGSISLIYWFRA